MSFHEQLHKKIVGREGAKIYADALHGGDSKLVFTNGVFDILHPGHVDYLAKARDLGDFLVVGLNTDASVRRLGKEPGRPINDEQSRARVLAALDAVDLVVLFDDDTPYELIRELKPDILVKGDDYKIEQIAGHDLVLANGGQVITVPLVKGYSTTNLVDRIRKS
jgi:D-glycero-beta-D-manno-heptose 1-phosphate adenylyltransferase